MTHSKHFEDTLLPKIIRPSVSNALANVDEEFSDAVGLKSRIDDEHYILELSQIYEEKRDWLRRIYFGEDAIKRSVGKEDFWLDMHKIAAVLCRSILACKPISFNYKVACDYLEKHDKSKDINWLSKNFLINYKIAVDVAMGICFYDLIDRLGDDENKKKIENVDGLIKKLSNSGRLDYYSSPTFKQNHSNFYISLIEMLATNDTHNRNFDYLSFATICFQLQNHNVLEYKYNFMLNKNLELEKKASPKKSKK